MPSLQCGGEPFDVAVSGPPGAPALLLSNSLSCDLAMWDHQVAAWGDRFRVIRYDGRGQGGSVRTAESRDRTDLRRPPAWFLLLEATDTDALGPLMPDAELSAAGLRDVDRGHYRLEHVRGRTAWK